MDVDLSTDLRALLPLVAPLLSGHSDLAIGTRLARGARVVRGPKRELISRTYNRLLRTRAARALLRRAVRLQGGARATPRAGCSPQVEDDGWFFDTELLVLAQRDGLRIHEVPVDWVDDPDSRVDIVRTALDDLRGIARLLAAGPVPRFLGVGVCSTLAYALLYLAAARAARRRRRRTPRRSRSPPSATRAANRALHLRRARPRGSRCASTRWARSSTS